MPGVWVRSPCPRTAYSLLVQTPLMTCLCLSLSPSLPSRAPLPSDAQPTSSWTGSVRGSTRPCVAGPGGEFPVLRLPGPPAHVPADQPSVLLPVAGCFLPLVPGHHTLLGFLQTQWSPQAPCWFLLCPRSCVHDVLCNCMLCGVCVLCVWCDCVLGVCRVRVCVVCVVCLCVCCVCVIVCWVCVWLCGVCGVCSCVVRVCVFSPATFSCSGGDREMDFNTLEVLLK